MFEHVLVATDGSDSGMDAARVGLELASTCEASVTVVVVADGELSASNAQSVVDDVTALDAASRVSVRTRVVEGEVRSAIPSVAADVNADLIAMGRHGHTSLGERFLGSQTERVLRATDRPVLTVPEQGDAVGGFEDVLMPSDGSDTARAAVLPGVSLARSEDATLHVLSVVHVAREAGPFSAGGVTDEYVDGLVADAANDLDAFAAACEEAADDDALDLTRSVRTGSPPEEIAAYVDEQAVDLVAMASRGEGSFTGQLFGSTTNRVLGLVDVPVLVVQPDA